MIKTDDILVLVAQLENRFLELVASGSASLSNKDNVWALPDPTIKHLLARIIDPDAALALERILKMKLNPSARAFYTRAYDVLVTRRG